MSQLEILTAPCAVDLHLTSSPPSTFTEPLAQSFADKFFKSQNSLPRSLHTDSELDTAVLFPDLPPLLRGHPDLHLRNGIMRAGRLAAIHEPDAEKAFFVADLSVVYNQYERWKRNLPEVEPFYGMLCPSSFLCPPSCGSL